MAFEITFSATTEIAHSLVHSFIHSFHFILNVSCFFLSTSAPVIDYGQIHSILFYCFHNVKESTCRIVQSSSNEFNVNICIVNWSLTIYHASTSNCQVVIVRVFCSCLGRVSINRYVRWITYNRCVCMCVCLSFYDLYNRNSWIVYRLLTSLSNANFRQNIALLISLSFFGNFIYCWYMIIRRKINDTMYMYA